MEFRSPCGRHLKHNTNASEGIAVRAVQKWGHCRFWSARCSGDFLIYRQEEKIKETFLSSSYVPISDNKFIPKSELWKLATATMKTEESSWNIERMKGLWLSRVSSTSPGDWHSPFGFRNRMTMSICTYPQPTAYLLNTVALKKNLLLGWQYHCPRAKHSAWHCVKGALEEVKETALLLGTKSAVRSKESPSVMHPTQWGQEDLEA